MWEDGEAEPRIALTVIADELGIDRERGRQRDLRLEGLTAVTRPRAAGL